MRYSTYIPHLAFTFIIILAVVLRFYRLGEIPIALNRDEASLGYTAWSILHTGKDEHGVSFPINIQSFGDWKLPLYVYTLIPLINVFGLSEWSVRLPSALSGVGIVILSFIITRIMLEREKQTTPMKIAPYLVSLFVAISPWSIHLSRIAYEANLTMFVFCLGVVCFLMAVERHLSVQPYLKKWLVWGYPLSVLLFGLTFFGYHSYQVFTPLFGIGLLALYKKQLMKLAQNHYIVFASCVLIGISAVGILLLSQRSLANQTKFSGLSIFSEDQYAQSLFEERQLTAELGVFNKVYANSYTLLLMKVASNISQMLSPNFLFISGGTHGSHNFVKVANFHWFALFTIPVGLYAVLSRKYHSRYILVVWMLCAMIAPLITIESAHSIRLSPILLPFEICSALGILFLLKKIHERKQLNQVWIFSLIGTIGVITYSLIYASISYFVIFPVLGRAQWPWYMSDIVSHVHTTTQERMVYMQGESSSPYIWFLFYDPEKYTSTERIYYPPTDEGFVHVQSMANIQFGDIDWEDVFSSSQSATFILRPSEIQQEVVDSKKLRIEKELKESYSSTEYQILTYDP